MERNVSRVAVTMGKGVGDGIVGAAVNLPSDFLLRILTAKVARTRHRAQHLGTVSGGAAVPGAGRAAGAATMPVHGIGSDRRAMAAHVLRTGGSRLQSHACQRRARAVLNQASNADCASSPRLGLAGNKTIGRGVEGILGADESVPGQVPAWKRDPRTSEARRSGHWPTLEGCGEPTAAKSLQTTPGCILQGTACNGTMPLRPGARNTHAPCRQPALAWSMVPMPPRDPAVFGFRRKGRSQTSRAGEPKTRSRWHHPKARGCFGGPTRVRTYWPKLFVWGNCGLKLWPFGEEVGSSPTPRWRKGRNSNQHG
jgi:hypothetical protein